MDILILLADLALTVFVYCSPAAVYRFLIKKEPTEKIPARKFCIISSVIVYLILLVIYLSAGFDTVPNITAAVLWGFVSYRVLLYADKKSNTVPSETDATPIQLSIFDSPEIESTSDKPPQEQEPKPESPTIPEPPPHPEAIQEKRPINRKIDGGTVIILVVLILIGIFELACFIYAIAMFVSM